MILRAAVVFFLSFITGSLMIPVPESGITDCGVPLAQFTLENGPTAVSYAQMNLWCISLCIS